MSGICLPIDAGGPFPAAQHRVAQSPLFTGGIGRPLGARSGVRAFAEPVVTIASTTTFTVSPFSAIVDPGTALSVGAYLVAFLATETVTYGVADGSATRVDDVSVVVPDDPAGAFGNVAKIVVTPGIAGGAAGVTPARAMQLGQLTVPKAGTGSAVFAPSRIVTVANGGILPTYASWQRPNPDAGRYVDDVTAGKLLRGNGTGFDTVADKTAYQPWVAYAPIFGGNDGSVATGATVTGSYRRTGSICDVKGQIVTGATGLPTGAYRVSLPVPAANTSGYSPVGTVLFVGGAFVTGICFLDSSSGGTYFLMAFNGGAGPAGVGNPASWASRTVTFRCSYEVAPL